MKKTVLTFGLLAGGVLSAMMLITMPFVDQIGFDRAEVVGYTTMVLAFLLVFFGIRSYRDNVAGGSVGFGRAMAVGSLIVLVASVCYVATWEVYAHTIGTDHMDKYQTYALEQARAEGGTPAEVQARVDQVKHFGELYRNPVIGTAMAFIEPLPVGLVMALVSAGILSRRRRGSEAGLAPAVG